jgi:hypothetical protein
MSILAGVFHTRIEYPEGKEKDGGISPPAKEKAKPKTQVIRNKIILKES